MVLVAENALKGEAVLPAAVHVVLQVVLAGVAGGAGVAGSRQPTALVSVHRPTKEEVVVVLVVVAVADAAAEEVA